MAMLEINLFFNYKQIVQYYHIDLDVLTIQMQILEQSYCIN